MGILLAKGPKENLGNFMEATEAIIKQTKQTMNPCLQQAQAGRRSADPTRAGREAPSLRRRQPAHAANFPQARQAGGNAQA